MPKELIHWKAAWEALRRLPADSGLRKSIEANRNCYLAGAVLPDTLLHFLGGPYQDIAFSLCDSFHSPKKSSYLPLLNFLDSVETASISPAVEAALLGISCHMEADILFHPFVYAISGMNMGIHYRTETELDLWLLGKGSSPPVFRLNELLDPAAAMTLINVLGGVFDPDRKLPDAAITKSLENHALFQSMYSSPLWIITARTLGLIPGTPVKNWQWLFYPLRWKQGRDFEWPAEWRDPVSGKKRIETPDELLERVIERIGGILQETEQAGLKSAFAKQPGENLLTGLLPE